MVAGPLMSGRGQEGIGAGGGGGYWRREGYDPGDL